MWHVYYKAMGAEHVSPPYPTEVEARYHERDIAGYEGVTEVRVVQEIDIGTPAGIAVLNEYLVQHGSATINLPDGKQVRMTMTPKAPAHDPFNCPKCGRHDYGLIRTNRLLGRKSGLTFHSSCARTDCPLPPNTR